MASIALFSIVSCSNDTTVESENNLTTKTSFTSDGVMRGWSKAGNCLRGYGNCAVCIVDETFTGGENDMPVNFILTGNQLTISNAIKKENEDGNKVTFEDDFALPAQIAKNLGYISITILKGQYTTTFENNQNGETIVNVEAN